MSQKQSGPTEATKTIKSARQKKLEKALRDNLKRRKHSVKHDDDQHKALEEK